MAATSSIADTRIALTRFSATPTHLMVSAMASGAIDLTNLEDSSEDSDVRIVKTVVTQPQTKKATPSSASKPASTKRPSNGLAQRRKHGSGPIDLMSDSDLPSPGSGEFRLKERINGVRHPAQTQTAARKSVPSDPSSIPNSTPDLLDAPTSSDGELPELPKFSRAPSSANKPSQSKQGSAGGLSSIKNALKRPLNLTGSSSLGTRSPKRAKLDTLSAAGTSSPKVLTDTAKKASQPSTLKKALGPPSHGSSLVTSQQNKTSSTLPMRKPAPGSTDRERSDRQSSSPLGSQRSNGGPLSKKRSPFTDLHASEKKRSARQQTASQEDGNKTSTLSRPTSSQLKEHQNGTTSQSRPPPKDPKSSGMPGASQPEAFKAGRSASRNSPKKGPSSTQVGQASKQVKLASQTSRALNLLNQRSNRGGKKDQHQPTGSSDEDQGYGSLGSGSAGDHAQDSESSNASPSASSLQKAAENSVPGVGSTAKAKDDTPALQTKQTGKAANSHGESRTNDTVVEEVAGSLQAGDKASQTISHTEVTKSKTLPAQTPAVDTTKKNALDRVVENQEVPNAVGASGTGAPPEGQRKRFEADMETAEANHQLQSEAMRAGSAPASNEAQSAASALESSSVYTRLPLASKVDTALNRYLEELAQDNEYWTGDSLMRARLSKEIESARIVAQEEEPTSFRHMKPVKLSPAQRNDPRELIWGVEKMISGKPVTTEKFTVPRKTFTTVTQDVPNYAHYVSITSNILAQNSKTLHCWPYFGDDFISAEAENLKENYHLDIDGREQKLLRLRQAQRYEEYVESALSDLGCSWSDVLRFLLEERPAVGITTDAMKALNNRQEFCKEEFDRHNRRWAAVLSLLPPSTTEQMACAAVFCDTFQKITHFPLWHIARRSDLCKLPDKAQVPSDTTIASNELTCRTCLRFNCPYHGEISEQVDGDDEEVQSDTSSVSVVATDLVHPPKINYRTRVAFPAAEPVCEEADRPAAKPGKKDFRYWQSFQYKPDTRGPFYPCSHSGLSCDDEEADCSCYADNLPCEKFCGCDNDCSRKFSGCSCSTERIRTGKRGSCFDDERCICWQLGRECDPDLCRECGVCEVVDPVNRHDESVPLGRCHNASIQRAIPKCTLLGDSGIHGLGLYACENIRQNEFLGEYKGEIITKDEAERRGAVYEHQKLSYLFTLNSDQEIDSTYFGNKIRFINHAGGNKQNLYPRIIMVNTVHRIALYAARNIRKGEELLFDYGPQFPDEQLGGKKSKKSAPHVRNANLVRDFYEVEEDEDELGNVRAKGVTGGRKAKKSKPKGGARTGAGRKPRRDGSEQQAPLGEAREREESPFENGFSGQDAGERLAAYNVADDRASDQMDLDFQTGLGAEDNEDDEYQESEEEESEASEDDESSEDEVGEMDGVLGREPRRPSKRTSWRT